MQDWSQSLKVSRLDGWEDKQVLPQGWKVSRLEGREEKKVLLQGQRVNRLEGWNEKKVLPQDGGQPIGRLVREARSEKQTGLM